MDLEEEFVYRIKAPRGFTPNQRRRLLVLLGEGEGGGETPGTFEYLSDENLTYLAGDTAEFLAGP